MTHTSQDSIPENTEVLNPAESAATSDAPVVDQALAGPQITDLTQIEQVLEAIIFAAPRAMTLIRL